MDLDDRVPLLLGHVGQHPVAQDAGVVDQHVEVAEGLDRGVDQALRAFPGRDVVAVGDRLATHAADLLDHLLGRTEIAAGAVHVAAEVVDHDLAPWLGQAQRVLAADAPAGAGDDGHPAITESHLRNYLLEGSTPASCPPRPNPGKMPTGRTGGGVGASPWLTSGSPASGSARAGSRSGP